MIHIYKNSPDARSKLQRILKMTSKGDTVILLGDGVLNFFLVDSNCWPEGVRACYLENDLEARGLKRPINGEIINMSQFVEIIASDPCSPISW